MFVLENSRTEYIFIEWIKIKQTKLGPWKYLVKSYRKRLIFQSQTEIISLEKVYSRKSISVLNSMCPVLSKSIMQIMNLIKLELKTRDTKA